MSPLEAYTLWVRNSLPAKATTEFSTDVQGQPRSIWRPYRPRKKVRRRPLYLVRRTVAQRVNKDAPGRPTPPAERGALAVGRGTSIVRSSMSTPIAFDEVHVGPQDAHEASFSRATVASLQMRGLCGCQQGLQQPRSAQRRGHRTHRRGNPQPSCCLRAEVVRSHSREATSGVFLKALSEQPAQPRRGVDGQSRPVRLGAQQQAASASDCFALDFARRASRRGQLQRPRCRSVVRRRSRACSYLYMRRCRGVCLLR